MRLFRVLITDNTIRSQYFHPIKRIVSKFVIRLFDYYIELY